MEKTTGSEDHLPDFQAGFPGIECLWVLVAEKKAWVEEGRV